jgi:surface polysaccharide O-acyltransferase-like enzyme
MHRGVFQNNYSILQNVFYFTPVYLIGMILSEKKNVIYLKFKGKEFYLIVLIITLAVTQAYIGKSGNYHKNPFSINGIDLMIIQKIILCLFFMIYLNRHENSKYKLLKTIAENSFGIFFIHGIYIRIIYEVKLMLGLTFITNSFGLYFIIAMLVFCISLISSILIKKLLPNYSKYLVGS